MANKILYNLIKFSTQLYFGWVLFIALLTLLPGQAIPDLNWNFLSIDKLIHFTLFAVMSFLGGVQLYTKKKSPTIVLSSIISVLIAVIYGFILEYFQTFIPQRTFDYADLTANVGGASVGIIMFIAFQARFRR